MIRCDDRWVSVDQVGSKDSDITCCAATSITTRVSVDQVGSKDSDEEEERENPY